MKFCKKIGIISFLVIINYFISVPTVFAYDSEIAHPNIAKMAIETFNNHYDLDLSDADAKLIMQGSVEEDTPIRWMNHFYDPIYNEGLFFNEKQYQTSKTWSINSEDQSTYGRGDNTWYRAIDDYKKGNKEEALKELGHIIHLVSDMGVPAHTRNDPHADENSYEDFVHDNWINIYNNLNKNLITKELNNLDQAFDELANYSNSNFYTQDTLESSKYKIINVTGYDKLGIFLYAKNNNILLYRIKKDRYIDTKEVNIDVVFNNNAQNLIPKSVEYSAGVIKLFFDEVNKEQNVSLSSVRSKLFTLNKIQGGLVGGAMAMDNSMFNIFSNLIRVGKNTNTALARDSAQIRSAYNGAVNSVQNNLSKITFDQIISLLPKQPLIVANVPKLTDSNIISPVLPQPQNIQEPQIESPQPTPPQPTPPPKQKSNTTQDNSQFHFVFGAGGQPSKPQEVSAPVEAEVINEDSETTPEPAPGHESSPTETTTTTEEIIETPTSTVPIIDESPTSTEPIVEVDTTPPNTPNLDLTKNVSITTSSTAQLSWFSLSGDIANYDVEYKTDGDWQTIFIQTTSTNYLMNVDNFKTYSFRVRATDTSTNTSNWSEKSILIDYSKTVVINEIAWMGTAANRSSDEWLELYNNTDADISLNGWKLKVSGSAISWNNTSSTIKSHGYYLLERTSDTTVADIIADGIFTISGGLKNTGENLVLVNCSGEIIDQVDNTNGWFAGQTGTKYKTMERINVNNPGNWANNWQSSDSFSVKGRPQGGDRIYGTPRQPNQGYWYLQNLTYNYIFDENKTLTLTAENNPYFIDNVTEIPAGYTLKLGEGVIIAGVSNSAYLKVKGSLVIEGTPEKPVVFTSARDKNYIDFNLTDLTGDTPEPGDWSRIEVLENGKLSAGNVKFFYGGQKYFVQGGFVFGGKWPVRIINNLGGEVSLDNASFQNNFTHAENEDKAYDSLVWIEPAIGFSATTTIGNSIFDGGFVAIKNQKQNQYLSIFNSTFKNFTNINGPISSRYDLPVMENNILENNARNILEIQQLDVNKDMIFDAQKEYLVNNIIINAGAVLKIMPGAIINLGKKAGITVNGSLEAIGTESNKIIFRPAKTDEKWGSILFNNSTSTLEYVGMDGGNDSNISPAQNNGMICMKNSNITLKNVSLVDADRPYNMIYIKDSQLDMKDSLISWFTPNGSKHWTIVGIKFDGGRLHLDNVSFNQMDRGIELYNLGVIETENMTLGNFTNISDLNWWPVNAIQW